VQPPPTAVVTGPAGDEIYTDKYGRVKVQFHWDRKGKKDENSSCWVRVSSPWAGKNWGGISIPRIGQEVVVDFLEGDPDRPLITGRVYNADQTADADAVATPTQSVIRTHSSPDGADDNFNELRFEDQKDAELISIHAEKDFERVVENNDALRVGFDKKDEGNQTIDIYNNRTVTIEEGTDTLTIKKGDRVVSIDEGNDELTIKQGDQTITITEGKCTIEAGTSIELKVGDSSLKIDTSSITLAAADISVTGDTTAEMTSATTTVNGDTNLTLKGGQVAIN
jgi:type VI secretion system secreted protein VgrG